MGLQDLINKYDNGGFSKTGWFQLRMMEIQLQYASSIRER